jgi:hypothetical protein
MKPKYVPLRGGHGAISAGDLPFATWNALTHDDSDSEYDALDDQPVHDDHQPAHDDQPRYRYVRTKWSTEEKQSLKEIAVDHHFDEKRILQDSREGLLPNRTIKSIRKVLEELKVDLDVEDTWYSLII